MIINNIEKQVLQKYYAERIKSRAANLKEIIQQDKQDVLANTLLDIKEDAKKICQIQNEWRNDTAAGVRHDTVIFNEAEKLEQKIEDGYEK